MIVFFDGPRVADREQNTVARDKRRAQLRHPDDQRHTHADETAHRHEERASGLRIMGRERHHRRADGETQRQQQQQHHKYKHHGPAFVRSYQFKHALASTRTFT